MPRIKLLILLLLAAFGATVWVRSHNRHLKLDSFDQQCIDAGLEQHVHRLDLTGLTPRQAIEQLRKVTGADIVPDWESLRHAGIGPEDYRILVLHLNDTTLEQALDWLLGVEGGYDISGRSIRLASRDDLVHRSTIHDLRGIIPAGEFSRPYVWPPALLQEEMRLLRVQQMLFRQVRAQTQPSGSPLSAPLVVSTPPLPYRTFGDEAAGKLRDRIMRQLLDEWVRPPSRPGAPLTGSARVEAFDGFLFVYQTRQRQREIRRMLAQEGQQWRER